MATQIRFRNEHETSYEEVNQGHPFPVEVLGEAAVRSPETYDTGWIPIPGLHTGSAYASGDALGTRFVIPVPNSGRIERVLLLDQDKEQLSVDLVLFTAEFTATADDSPMDITDADMYLLDGVINVATYYAFNDNALGQETGVGYQYKTRNGRLLCQCVARGAQNLTAASDYAVRLIVLPDRA